MWHEIFEDDCVVMTWSSALSILEDWLKEWDEMKSLAKVVKILEEFLMISYTHQY